MQGQCLRVPVPVIKYHNHKQLGRIGFISVFWVHIATIGEVRAGIHGGVLLTDLFLIAQSAFLEHRGPHTPITNLENALQSCLQPNLVEAFSRLRFLPLR